MTPENKLEHSLFASTYDDPEFLTVLSIILSMTLMLCSQRKDLRLQ